MNIAPSILRELREQARSAANHWQRTVCVGLVAVLLTIGFFKTGLVDLGDLLPAGWAPPPQASPSFAGFPGAVPSVPAGGGETFGRLNLAVTLVLLVLVPAMVSDSLSREKREGTLGLLFLTPLRAVDVVLSKVAAHGFRAVMLWLAVVPLLALPLLLGGIDVRDCLLAVLFQFALLLLGLGAGILGSTFCSRAGSALASALLLNVLFLLVLVNLHHAQLSELLRSSPSLARAAKAPGTGRLYVDATINLPEIRSRLAIKPLLEFHCGMIRYWNNWGFAGQPRFSTPWRILWTDYGTDTHRRWMGMVALTVAGSGFWTVLCILIAARAVNAWVRPARVDKLVRQVEARAAVVVFPELARRWSRWSRERNPFGWLGRQSWQSRMVSWLWLGATMVISSVLLLDSDFRSFGFASPIILGALALVAMIFVSTMSFQRDRDLGALELLLVSPASARQLIMARIKSLWMQALPAALFMLWLIQFLDGSRLMDGSGPGMFLSLACLTAAFSCVPVGLFYGLQCRTWLSAVLRTSFWGFLFPLMAAATVHGGFSLFLVFDPFNKYELLDYQVWATLSFLLLGLVYTFRLIRQLEHRQFAFH